MEFKKERYSEQLVCELLSLLQQHHEEVSHCPDVPIEPDFNIYRKMEDMGILRIFTARENGEIVGYSVFFVSASIHHKSKLQAAQDLLFLRPDYRRGFTAYRFIKWCDDQLRADGVKSIFQYVNVKSDFGSLLERMGYNKFETLYVRRV